MKKIKAVTKKLNGIKPSLIILDQLKEQYYDKYFDRYFTIITGNDDIKRIRVKMNDFLTPEEQVVLKKNFIFIIIIFIKIFMII